MTVSDGFDAVGKLTAMAPFWKTALKVAAFALGAPTFLFALLLLWIIISEWDSRFRGRIAMTRSDMQNLQLAIAAYRERQGRLPVSMEELAPSDVPEDQRVLPHVVSSAWGTPYVFEIVNEDAGARVRIWTTPDAEVQRRCHRERLSSDLFASDEGTRRVCL